MSIHPTDGESPVPPPTAPKPMLATDTEHEFTEADLVKLARLARLHVEPDERADLIGRLAAILEHARSLESLDLGSVQPLSHAHEEAARLQEDIPSEPLPRQALGAIAPAWEAPFIKVPKVLGGE